MSSRFLPALVLLLSLIELNAGLASAAEVPSRMGRTTRRNFLALLATACLGGSCQSHRPPDGPAKDTGSRSEALTLMNSLRGRPYVWGATGPDQFDCSGFVHYIISSQVGSDHYKFKEVKAIHYRKLLMQAHARIEPSQARAGDIVYFPAAGSAPAHIGIITIPAKRYFLTAQGRGLGVSDGAFGPGQFWANRAPEVYRNIWF